MKFQNVFSNQPVSAPERSDPSAVTTTSRQKRLEQAAPVLLGFVIAILVCAPFFKGGWLLLLDWVIGPHSPILAPTFYGLSGGINADFLFGIVISTLVHIFGSVMTWLPIFFFFPLACFSISRVVRGNLVAQLAAGLFFSINPFVVDRIYAGQLGLLYGYLLLPVLFNAVAKWLNQEKPKIIPLALILTLMISIDVHYAWIGGLIIAVGVGIGIRKPALRKSVPRLILLLIPLNIYLVIPVLGHPLSVNPKDNGALLKAFQTIPDPHLGLYANVIGLYGFWRPIPESSKVLVSGWPFFLLGIFILAAYGLHTLWKKQKNLALLVGISFLVAYFLALGGQGPTGQVFQWAYQHLPGFSMMREPEKFSGILATSLSLLFGEGLAKLSTAQSSHKTALAIVSLGFLLVIGYNPVIFWGIHGQVETSQIPASWNTTARLTKGASGKTLVLPWHQYLSFPFTGKRIIANPGKAFFPGDVITGDNVEIANVYTTANSHRSKYLTWLASHGQETRRFGSLLAPLGVQYVVIYKTFVTGNTSWINHQKDLKVVYEGKSIEILKNLAFAGISQFVSGPPEGNTFQRLLTYSNTGARTHSEMHNAQDQHTKIGRTTISFQSPLSNWLHVALPYQPGWTYKSHEAIESSDGTMTFKINSRNGNITYQPWRFILIGYLLSLFTNITAMLIFRRQRSDCSD